MTERAGNGEARVEPDAAPATPAEEGPAADTAIPDLLNRIAELEDLRLRALADLDNLRKRCGSQVSRAEQETRAAVAREWLPVIDNLDRALAHSGADPDALIEGVRQVRGRPSTCWPGLATRAVTTWARCSIRPGTTRWPPAPGPVPGTARWWRSSSPATAKGTTNCGRRRW